MKDFQLEEHEAYFMKYILMKLYTEANILDLEYGVSAVFSMLLDHFKFKKPIIGYILA